MSFIGGGLLLSRTSGTSIATHERDLRNPAISGITTTNIRYLYDKIKKTFHLAWHKSKRLAPEGGIYGIAKRKGRVFFPVVVIAY